MEICYLSSPEELLLEPRSIAEMVRKHPGGFAGASEAGGWDWPRCGAFWWKSVAGNPSRVGGWG